MFAHKTMMFIRAPDENVYIAPFNLVEIFLVAIPFEWWMDKKTYERINDITMAIVYFPFLLASAYFEVRAAQEIRSNRARGDEDDDTVEEWEQMSSQIDFEADGWNKRVEVAKTNLEEDLDVTALTEIRKLKEEVETLKAMIQDLHGALRANNGESNSGEPSS